MKLFTSDDPVTTRAIFKKKIKFIPQFRPFFRCNYMPNINTNDDDIWRKINIIPFESKFVKRTKTMKKNSLGKNQFWIEDSLSKKLPLWKQAFMGILLRYYRKYIKYGLVRPPSVIEETEMYRIERVFLQFVFMNVSNKQVIPFHRVL